MSVRQNGVLYYPQIPKAVDQYLRIAHPRKYNNGTYRTLLAPGASVKTGDVIATYGDNKITAPCDGVLVFVSARPGLHEWPDLREEDLSICHISDLQGYEANNINLSALVFPKSIPVKEAYAFAIEPDQLDSEEVYLVSKAFDGGKVWHDGKKPTMWGHIFNRKVHTFYTLIDLLNYKNGIRLPDQLANDRTYRVSLGRYWPLINKALAAKELLPGRSLHGPN